MVRGGGGGTDGGSSAGRTPLTGSQLVRPSASFTAGRTPPTGSPLVSPSASFTAVSGRRSSVSDLRRALVSAVVEMENKSGKSPRAPLPGQEQTGSDAGGVEGGARPLRVLLADDEPTNLRIMALCLTRQKKATAGVTSARNTPNVGEASSSMAKLKDVPIEVVLAKNGDEALAKLLSDSEAFDAALLDEMMPGRLGSEVAVALRQAEATFDNNAARGGSGRRQRRVPVCVVSANCMAADVAKYAARGVDGFVSKPIPVRDMANSVRALVGASRAGELGAHESYGMIRALKSGAKTEATRSEWPASKPKGTTSDSEKKGTTACISNENSELSTGLAGTCRLSSAGSSIDTDGTAGIAGSADCSSSSTTQPSTPTSDSTGAGTGDRMFRSHWSSGRGHAPGAEGGGVSAYDGACVLLVGPLSAACNNCDGGGVSTSHDVGTNNAMARLLEVGGFEVLRAATGAEAVNLVVSAQRSMPHAVVIDSALPDMPGVELVAVLRTASELQVAPIILAIENDDSEGLVAALNAGATDCVSRGLLGSEIIARLNTQLRLLESKRAEVEAEANYRLLRGLLPEHIIGRLKAGQHVMAETYDDLTVIFVDVVSFTEISSLMNPPELVLLLNDLFARFDGIIADHHDVMRVETRGDSYVIVCGIDAQGGTADAVLSAEMKRLGTAQALALSEKLLEAATGVTYRVQGCSERRPLRIRVGINCGPASAGVVGITSFSYIFFGDTVNIAARMESNGHPMTIKVSEAVVERLTGTTHSFEPAGMANIKGKGPMATYYFKTNAGGHGVWQEAAEGDRRKAAAAAGGGQSTHPVATFSQAVTHGVDGSPGHHAASRSSGSPRPLEPTARRRRDNGMEQHPAHVMHTLQTMQSQMLEMQKAMAVMQSSMQALMLAPTFNSVEGDPSPSTRTRLLAPLRARDVRRGSHAPTVTALQRGSGPRRGAPEPVAKLRGSAHASRSSRAVR